MILMVINNMPGKNIVDDNQAVSPIIATILMVAITVIMAAIIANWSAGVKAPVQPQSVGLDVSRLSQNNVTLTITSIDPPYAVVDAVRVTFKNGTNQLTTKSVLGSGAPNQSGYYGSNYYPDLKTSYEFSSIIDAPLQANVGDSVTLWLEGFNEFIVITVRYGDGSTKTIYSQKV